MDTFLAEMKMSIDSSNTYKQKFKELSITQKVKELVEILIEEVENKVENEI